MKKSVILLAFHLLVWTPPWCQTTTNFAHEAFMVTRMVNKFHVQPRAVDSRFSADVFKSMLRDADPDKIYFLKPDIDRLSIYRNILDKEISQQKDDFLRLFTVIYQQRLKQADSIITEISKKSFNLNLSEKFTAVEDTTWPASVAAMQHKLHLTIKADILSRLAEDIPPGFASFTSEKQKKYTDSAETVLRRKTTSSLKRKIAAILQGPYGIGQYTGNLYCSTIASCFDPHTEFFPPEEREQFEGALGNQRFVFGFTLKENKNGSIIIDGLQPGSPAYKGGKLNKGDKFISMQWDGGAAIDVSDISVDEFTGIIDQSDHKSAVFTVKKADGSIVQTTLQKEQMQDNGDEDKVKSFILKGAVNIGYIYLPAFYEDWNSDNQGLNGCANDVGREILKLEKQNISGLILDLRYNGGGSAQEATELSGIFIDAGPVAQVKNKEGKVYSLKDADRGTVYDGPLVILVNGYSASAAELVAGTLQDYNRAVIIGAPTYGKATMQVVLPMDTTITPENFSDKQTPNYIKVTVSKLYRVNGGTAQFEGVQPDVLLPDILNAYATKERDEPFALRPNTIEANKYYTPYPPLPLKMLAAAAQPEIDTTKYFKAVNDIISFTKKESGVKDISLDMADLLKDADLTAKGNIGAEIAGTPAKQFTVQNSDAGLDRIQSDTGLEELNKEFSKQISADAYISVAYDVLIKMKP
jgi:carboxyl-terminal processing protease